jgi:SNF2 family DNA or RNA helicase
MNLATWDIPPERGSPAWDAWEAAFSRFIQAQSVFIAKTTAAELEKRDSRNPTKFGKNNMKIAQSFVHDKGLKLRPFQLDGVNWLSFQWWRRHPAILADEMGLVS